VSSSLKKRSLLLLVSVGVLIALSVQNLFDVGYIAEQDYEVDIGVRERLMYSYAQIAAILVRNDELDLLKERLDRARADAGIDFYVLYENGKPLIWASNDGTLRNLEVTQTYDESYRTDKISVIGKTLDAEHWFMIGLNISKTSFYQRYGHKYFYLHAQQILWMTIMVIGVFFYFSRDILAIISIVRKQGDRSFGEVKAHSREAELFLQGLAGYEEKVVALAQANQVLGGQVLPSLKTEILSGRKPPYDFDCTMVRTDINNFSQIYNNNDVTTFMAIINEFFTEVTHLVSRYDGLIHEFVGDEVIFYFKDENTPNSFFTALSALRDIDRIAIGFNARTMKEQGYPFTVKSSLAHGKMRFGPLVNAFGLAGSTLIETVRILAHVKEKDGNVIYFDSRHTPMIGEFCRYEEATRVQLKGFNGERTLIAYRGHRPLHDILNTLGSDLTHDLTYYRADRSLIEILRFMRENIASLSLKHVLQVVRILRTVHVTKSDPTLTAQLCQWLEEVGQEAEGGRESSKQWHVFSAASMLVLNLVPKSQCTVELNEFLSRYLKSPDRRTVANILEVLAYARGDQNSEFFNDLLEHDDNRVATNALVQAGKREINSQIMRQIRRMLASGEEIRIAAALFAIGEIARHHRELDVVYFNTHTEFVELFAGVARLADKSDSAMVRRQAQIALDKISEPAVSKAA
jgi:class 3 adenylate cyclase